MTSRKLTKNTVQAEPAAPVVIGLDIGYGYTKAVLGDQMVIFPSVAARAHEIRYNKDIVMKAHQGECITDDKEDWFVGDLALQQTLPAHQLQLQGRDGNTESNMQFRTRMMIAALAKLFPGDRNGARIRIIIATGLPVDHMADEDAMRKAFMGILPINASGSGFNAEIVECIIMPQPYGTMFGKMITADGIMDETLSVSRAAVVDIGRFTIDCALDMDGDYIDAESGSEEAGVYIVQKILADKYEATHGVKATRLQIDELLRTGKLNISGEVVDYSMWLSEALKPMIDATLSLMGRLWDKALDIQKIYVTGGGATLIFKYIKARYRQAVLVDDAQMANAIGYRNYAMYDAQNND